jgi:hypothetical protein
MDSLVHFDRELSPELHDNSQLWGGYLSHQGLVGGAQSIRTPETFEVPKGEKELGLRELPSRYPVDDPTDIYTCITILAYCRVDPFGSTSRVISEVGEGVI